MIDRESIRKENQCAEKLEAQGYALQGRDSEGYVCVIKDNYFNIWKEDGKMKEYEPIKNDDTVIAHHEDGSISKHKYGILKNDYMHKRISSPITMVYLPRTNKNYFITYNPTKGFRYEVLSWHQSKN